MSYEESLTATLGVLPEGGHFALFEAAHGELRHICQLPFSSLDEVSTGTEGWVAGICGSEISSVTCWNAETRADLALPLPSEHVPHSIAFAGQILYVGGRAAETLPFLGLYDLGEPSPQWKSIPMPEQDWYGKGLDALLIDGVRLIAIDNVLVPSWLLVYDISDPLEPKLSTVDQLNPHGTWEEVTGATAGHQWIAVLTTTASGWSGPKQHIALLDKGSLKEQAVVSAQRASYSQDPYDWSDVLFWEDLLLVAAGKDGLGLLDLARLEGSRVDAEVCSEELRFASLPSFPNEKVIRVLPGTFAHSMGVVMEHEGGIQSVLLSKQDVLDLYDHADPVPFRAIDRRNRQF
jgi:hypothetical protein